MQRKYVDRVVGHGSWDLRSMKSGTERCDGLDPSWQGGMTPSGTEESFLDPVELCSGRVFLWQCLTTTVILATKL
jgi:hypothetical protein